MPIYRVGVQEVHVSTIVIEAASKNEALQLVSDGEGDELILEYSHTLDENLWSAEEV